MNKKLEDIALIDMDGTIADYEFGLRNGIAPFVREEDLKWDVHDPNRPEYLRRLSKYIRTRNGFWEELPVIDAGMKIAIALGMAGFDIHILTKGPFGSINAWTEKVSWCKKNLNPHFGTLGKDYGISITSDKGLVYGKVLFDDYVPYCKRWLEWRPRGLVIQLETAQNKDWNHPNVIRYNGENFEEVREKIMQAKNRTGLFG